MDLFIQAMLRGIKETVKEETDKTSPAVKNFLSQVMEFMSLDHSKLTMQDKRMVFAYCQTVADMMAHEAIKEKSKEEKEDGNGKGNK